jgi:hypothetical protein
VGKVHATLSQAFAAAEAGDDIVPAKDRITFFGKSRSVYAHVHPLPIPTAKGSGRGVAKTTMVGAHHHISTETTTSIVRYHVESSPFTILKPDEQRSRILKKTSPSSWHLFFSSAQCRVWRSCPQMCWAI